MSDGYYHTSVLVWALHRWGPLSTRNRPGIRRLLRRSEVQLDRIVASAAEYGLVQSHEGSWVLTAQGATFGAQMAAAVEEARVRSRRPYRPFEGYLPEAWSIGE